MPDELTALGVTPETADHNDQISDYGFDLGGPIVRDKAWVWGSWTKQDIRLIRSAGALTDRTILKTYNLKGNWQATSKDMISVLWFLGDKVKYGRATGDAQVLARDRDLESGRIGIPRTGRTGLLEVREQPRVLVEPVPVEQVRLLRHRIQPRAAGRPRRAGVGQHTARAGVRDDPRAALHPPAEHPEFRRQLLPIGMGRQPRRQVRRGLAASRRDEPARSGRAT